MKSEYLIPVFQTLPQVGSATLRNLYEHHPDFFYWWEASEDSWIEALGKKKGTELFNALPEAKSRAKLDRIEQYFQDQSIDIIIDRSEEFPDSLREIPQSPFALYWRGSKVLPAHRVAIVGTRKYSSYGERAANFLASELAKSGVSIVSGLAKGVDCLAHQAAVESGGHTVAVLGGGSDDKTISPASNRALAKHILDTGGAIISEYAPGTPAHARFFPMRNRIVSGLAKGVIVIEAGLKSGTMITADLAKKQGRELFAVPGSIFDNNSTGTHHLIKHGAKIITDAHDILESIGMYGVSTPQESQEFTGTDEEFRIYQTLQSFPQGLSLNQLSETTGITAPSLMTTLTMLEMSGYTSQTQSGNYIALGNFTKT